MHILIYKNIRITKLNKSKGICSGNMWGLKSTESSNLCLWIRGFVLVHNCRRVENHWSIYSLGSNCQCVLWHPGQVPVCRYKMVEKFWLKGRTPFFLAYIRVSYEQKKQKKNQKPSSLQCSSTFFHIWY